MSDDGNRKPFPLITFVVLTTVGLLAIYILSPVPALYVMTELLDLAHEEFYPVWQIVYGPIEWACATFPAVRSFYAWQLTACGLSYR